MLTTCRTAKVFVMVDFHPKNLLGSLSHAKIIDWLDACQGDPAADVCRSYLLVSLYAPSSPPHISAPIRAAGG